MAQTTAETLPGRPGAPLGAGALYNARGSILELIDEVGRYDAANFSYERQAKAFGDPTIPGEGAEAVEIIEDTDTDASTDSDTYFELVTSRWTFWKGRIGFTDEALVDNAVVDRATLEQAITTIARRLISSEIVSPSSGSILWEGLGGFNDGPAIEVPVLVESGRVKILEPTRLLSRAMLEVSERFGCGPDGFQACLGARLCHEINSEAGGGWHRIKNLGTVVEQGPGFGVTSGSLLGIVGLFAPEHAQVAWNTPLMIEYAPVGSQFTQYRVTARVGARLGLAVKSPRAFCRLVVA